MKNFYSLVFAILFFTSSAFSQKAQNFIVTDPHGKTHNLYEDYLDKGITVVVDVFFVNCPPCNTSAPLLQNLYEEWGSGNGDVQFISLTTKSTDSDAMVIGYEEKHNLTFPSISGPGGGPAAVQQFTNGTFGAFQGAPTFLVIYPDKTVRYDAWASSWNGIMDIIDGWIEDSGAMRPLSSTDDASFNLANIQLYPNPAQNQSAIKFNLVGQTDVEIRMSNVTGQTVRQIHSGKLNAGQHIFDLPINELEDGNYLIQVKTYLGVEVLTLNVSK